MRTVSLGDLADVVAASAYGQPLVHIADHDNELVYNSLYRAHIPKHAAADIVEYDQATETVAIGEAAERAIPFLAFVSDKGTKAA